MKLKAFTGWHWEILCLLVYFMVTGAQLFVRPIVGLANNGDFPKVLAPADICDPNHERDVFAYVDPTYIISPECRWDSHVISSEAIFVRANKEAALWNERTSFRITGAGKAHLPVLLAALAILLWALHYTSRWLRFGLSALVLLIFSDVAYVAYLNSFYMDAASLVFLLLTVALAAAWVLRPQGWVAVAYGAAGVLMAFAKTQHVGTAFLLAVLAAWFAGQEFRRGTAGRRYGWYWAVSAAVVALASAESVRLAPPDIRAEPLYNLIFFRILPGSAHPGETLARLGLPQSDLAYSGTHAYFEGSPLLNTGWRNDFTRQATYGRVAAYYLGNPPVLLRQLERGLTVEISGIRTNFGNYRREDGFPPGARAHRFDWWSSLRMWFLRVAPAHIVIFYGVMCLGSLMCLFRKTWAARWPLYPLVLVLAGSGAVEFLSSVLLDCIETSRHLFLFHVITEVLIACAVGGILLRLPASRTPPAPDLAISASAAC